MSARTSLVEVKKAIYNPLNEELGGTSLVEVTSNIKPLS